MILKALIVIAALGAIVLALVPMQTTSGMLSRDLVDLVHLPLLALVTLAAFVIGERLPVSHIWQLAIAAGFGIAIAIAIELVQPSFSRTASLADIRTGLLGVFAACAAIQIWRGPRHMWLRIGYGLAIVASVALALRPMYDTWRAERRVRLVGPHYPLFADFEQAHELKRWKIHGTKDKRGSFAMSHKHASRGTKSLEVRTPGHSWNALGHSVRHRNWHRGNTFALDFFVTDRLAKVQLQIQDAAKTRFRRWLPVKRGWNTLRVPLVELRGGPNNIALDLRRVRYLTLSVPKGDGAHVYYVDNVRIIVAAPR